MDKERFAGVGAAASAAALAVGLAAGLSLAGPHTAVAAADSGDTETATAHSRAATAGPAARAATAGPAERAATAGRPANRAARTAADRPTPTGHLPAQVSLPAPAAAVARPTPRVTPRQAIAVATAEPAALPASPEEVAPVAAPDMATIATAHLTPALDLAGLIGHWLTDLPQTPGTDVLTGALLLMRRGLTPETPAVAARQALVTAAPGTSPVLTGMTSTPGSTSLVLSFNTQLVPDTATDLANYSITAPALFGNPEVVTRSGPKVRILAADYTDISETSSQVTLTLAHPLWQGVFYRVSINGELPVTSRNPLSNPVTGVGTGQTTFDGDNDGTPGGNFWGLFGVGSRLCFSDSSKDRVTLSATDGQMNVWRELNGDIDQVTVLPGTSALSGSVVPGRSSTGTVYIGSVTIPVPEPLDLNGAADNLPDAFSVVPPGGLTQPPPQPTQTSPTPIVATSQNLPYTLTISPVSVPGIENLPEIQSAVYAQTTPTSEYPSGLWVVFGGRTNGRHEFFPEPTRNFPPSYQNQNIFVINPVDWQVWSVPWSQTDVPTSTSNSLSSTNQQFYQKGDTLYTVGGYSKPGTVGFTGDVSTTSDTITVTGGLENLAVGQSVAGVVQVDVQVFPPDTFITAISGNTVTTNNPGEVDGTGLSLVASQGDFKTYDTLTALSLSGLAEAVINGDADELSTLADIRQISDPRLSVSGGGMLLLNGRSFLVGGHSFEGGYNGATATIAQVYTDEIRSFRIIDTGSRLAIADYQAQRDPVNFRRRDGNLVAAIGPRGQAQLRFLGGVFTTDGGGYQAPILIGDSGRARVDAAYQQYFSQYSTADFSLYDRRSGTNYTVLLGGISLYSYSDGELSPPSFDLPWTDNVTSLVQSADGSFHEYIMSPIPPAGPGDTGYYGAYAGYFQNQELPAYCNGVIALHKLAGPTVVGYMYGGIHSLATTPPPKGTYASNIVFQIVLTPTGAQTP